MLIDCAEECVGIIIYYRVEVEGRRRSGVFSSLNSTFVQSNPIIEVDGYPLIDFKLFSKLAEQVDIIVQYTPGDNSHTLMNDLSTKLALEERRMFETRERLRSLGLSRSPPRRE